MPSSSGEILRAGIARNAGAVLCLPSAGMLRHHATRFLGEGEDGFYVEAPGGEGALLDRLIAERNPVGIAFKSAQRKVVFTTPICERFGDFRLNPQTAVEALLLRFPPDVKPVQRRAHYRVPLPLEHALAVRMWRVPEHAILRDRPMAAQEIVLRARNLSVGGLGFVCPPRDGKPPRLLDDERVRLVMTWGEAEMLLEGRVRHSRPLPDRSLASGLQFKKLERELEGRQALSKIASVVGELQRDEICRRRGIADSGGG